MSVTLRLAQLSDVPLFERWDRQPHVIAAVHDDLKADIAFDADWAVELAHTDPASRYFIAEVNGRPIGAMQVIDPARERNQYWGAECPPNLRAIDIWIGEPDCLGKGYGTHMMTLTIADIFADPSVESIIIDPLASNDRAHRFYERLGFRFIERRTFGEDDCFVFSLDRTHWRLVAR